MKRRVVIHFAVSEIAVDRGGVPVPPLGRIPRGSLGRCGSCCRHADLALSVSHPAVSGQHRSASFTRVSGPHSLFGTPLGDGKSGVVIIRTSTEIDQPPSTFGGKRCGPDVTNLFVKRLKSFLDKLDRIDEEVRQARSRFGGRPDIVALKAHDAIYDAVAPGGWLDFKRLRLTRRSLCPRMCAPSLTMCGYCVRSDVPGNFALGLLTEYAGLGHLARPLSEADARLGRREEDPSDLSTIDSGQAAAGALKKAKQGKNGQGNEDDAPRKVVCDALAQLMASAPSIVVHCEPCQHRA